MSRQIHQIAPVFLAGDAVGNQVIQIQQALRDWGFASDIFARYWSPQLDGLCRDYQEYAHISSPNNLVLFHYSIGDAISTYIQTLPDQVVMYYHNITPAHYFYRTNAVAARHCADGRRLLQELAGQMRAIAASTYNRRELMELGYDVVGVAPYIWFSDELTAGVQSSSARQIQNQYANPELVNWLYVGRLAPHKCLHDLIKAFHFYHTWIEPRSRLFLVGAEKGNEVYTSQLRYLVAQLAVDDAVIFAGAHKAQNGLGAFFQLADVYLCLSEHEGFCVPLVEAMHFDLPIVAYAAAGVPDTLQYAGALIHHKEPEVIAELVREVITNETLRAALVAGQRQRLTELSPDKMRQQLRTCIDALT